MNSLGSPKQRVLVVSSTESLDVVDLMIENLTAGGFDVDSWSQIFRPSTGYLETLVNAVGYYDGVIAVFAADDEATIRHRRVAVTRDNVIFEFGLFLGRLGPKRTFFLIEEGVELFSDWSGLTIASYGRGEHWQHDVERACGRIRTALTESARARQFPRQPATALALEYDNYLRRLFDALEECDTLTVLEPGVRGGPWSASERRVDDHYPTVTVALPPSLSRLQDGAFQRATAGYLRLALRDRRGTIEAFGREGEDGRIQLFDVPLLLRGLSHHLDETFTRDFLDQERRAHVEAREIAAWREVLTELWPPLSRGPSVRFEQWE